MNFILLGFSQHDKMRRFTFERCGPGPGGSRETFTVEADTVLARRYKIAMQELPLLCRRLLEGPEPVSCRNIVFTEALMCSHAGALAMEVEQRELKKKPFRRHLPASPVQV